MPLIDPYASPGALAIVATIAAAATRRRPDLPGRVVVLTLAEADFLRQAGFPTAAAGAWTVDPLPPTWLVRQCPTLALMTGGPAVASPAPVVPPTPPTGSRYRPHAVPLSRWPSIIRSLTADQRRVVGALLRAPNASLSRRRLQQNCHRIPATRFTRALSMLVTVGIVSRQDVHLTVADEARTAIIAAGIGVHRGRSARAIAGPRATRTAPAAPTATAGPADRHNASTKPAKARSRRHLPPVGTSAWGRSMLARRGGLAVQKRYRLEGRHPTEAATRARLAKRRRETG